MMTGNTVNKLRGLLDQVQDSTLREQLEDEIDRLLKPIPFGLVFEEHTPEVLPMPCVAPRIGSHVVIKGEDFRCTWLVEELDSDSVLLSRTYHEEREEQRQNIDNITVVRRFGEAIYPKLAPIMEPLEQAGGQPFHTIIEADNFHALQLLSWGYKAKFDVIYIDPPYNTGNRDWKYNNLFLQDDRFRNSKWLSMMKKRLLLAKELLAKNGVLIVTIDDVEVAHLRMLLDTIFNERTIATVIIKYNPAGTARNGFSRQHEFAFFVMPEGFIIEEKPAPSDIRQRNLRRNGSGANRSDSPSMFYPIFVDKKTLKVIGAGPVPADEFHPHSQTVVREDCYELWPLDDSDREKRWFYGRERVHLKGTVELECRWVRERLHPFYKTDNEGQQKYTSIWNNVEYDAGANGGSLVKSILGREFPFPKSLYAVQDCLNAIVRNKPDALILDFFAGSGTTLHATLLLNAEDNGNRRCFLVTNNEVSEAEERTLSNKGLKRGDEEWELEGICRAITIPRCKYAINGKRDDGTSLPGSYLSGRAMSEGFLANLCAYRVDFLDPTRVERGCHFEDIAPILWLMAGAQGNANPHCEEDYGVLGGERVWWLPSGAPLAVLLDEHAFSDFLVAVAHRVSTQPLLNLIGLVTDSENAFNEMREQIRVFAPGAKSRQLYRDYLINFRLHDASLLEEKPRLERSTRIVKSQLPLNG